MLLRFFCFNFLLIIFTYILGKALQAKEVSFTSQSELHSIKKSIGSLQQEIKIKQATKRALQNSLHHNSLKQIILKDKVDFLGEQLSIQKKIETTIKENYFKNQQASEESLKKMEETIKIAYFLLYDPCAKNLLPYFNYIGTSRTKSYQELETLLLVLKQQQTDLSLKNAALKESFSEEQSVGDKLVLKRQAQQQALLEASLILQSKKIQLDKLLADRDSLERLIYQLRKKSRVNSTSNKTSDLSGAEKLLIPNNVIHLKGNLSWPVSGQIKDHYGSQIEQSELKYKGVDIITPFNEAVKAVYSGRVVFANKMRGLGLLIIIAHKKGFISLYGNCQVLYKTVGETVTAQETIGRMASSLSNKNPVLYFEFRQNSQPLNPENWFH